MAYMAGTTGSLRDWALSYVGLGNPRRYERTLIVLGVAVLAAIVGLVATILALRGVLTFPSPRSWHFIYLTGLLQLALLLVRWPRVSSTFLFIAALESLMGMGTAAVEQVGLTNSSFFPADSSYDAFGSRFTWHPLLQTVPVRDATLARGRVHHNSLGLRGPEQTAEALSGKTLIALFGGSTTYDVALEEGKTWPDRLAALLGKDRYAVLNNGVPGYTTVEAILQTAFYSMPYGLRPTCAVYLVGWNDVRNSHLATLDSAYADFHLPSQVDTNESRRLSGPGLFVSPVFAVSARFVAMAFDTVRPVVAKGKASGEPDARVESLFARNVETISAINRQRGIETIWIGQLMDPTRLTGDGPDRWVMFVPPRRIWPLVQRLNRIVEEQAKRLGDTYVFPSTAFGSKDFADEGHFSASGAIKFAQAIVDPIRARCH